MPFRLQLLALPVALGLVLVACRQQAEEASLTPSNPEPATPGSGTSGEPRTGTQGLEGFFTPLPGETWTYLVHRDLPPDSLLNDDDQLRSSDLPGGGYRLTSERQRVCLGSQDVEGAPHPLTLFDLSEDGVTRGREYFDIGPEGLVARGWRQAANAERPVALLNPGVLLAAPGLTGGQSWESTGTSPHQPVQFRAIERSTLEVPAGSFEAVRIQMNTGNDSRGIRRTLWFTENVGIIREETIHYDEHSIKIRETIELTGWTRPTGEDGEEEDAIPPPPEEAPVFPEVLPPPPDEEPGKDNPSKPVPGGNDPIVSPEQDEATEDDAPRGEEKPGDGT